MADLHVRHINTGQTPDLDITRRLDPCDGDTAAWLRAECGVDTRKLYTAQTAYPVQFRLVKPSHGQYPAGLYRPTRRERVTAWWECHRWPLLRGALLTLSLLAAYLALNLVITGLLDVVDWMSTR